MDLTQFYILLGTTGGLFLAGLATMISLFLWVRSEGNNDRRHFLDVQASDRRDILGLIRSIEQEMKDFHGRLCSIEERSKGN